MYNVIVHKDVELDDGMVLKAGEVYKAPHCYTHYIEVVVHLGYLESKIVKMYPHQWYHNCSLVKQTLYVAMQHKGLV